MRAIRFLMLNIQHNTQYLDEWGKCKTWTLDWTGLMGWTVD